MDKSYIKHSIGEIDGCGVIVGMYFITAAHVLEQGDFVFIHNDVTYTLTKKDAVIFKTMDVENNPDPEGCDLAVFKLENLISPLTLSAVEPVEGMKCHSVSYHHKGGEEECYIEIEGEAVVKTVDGNFFSCSMEKALKEGSSGSPVFDSEGAVAGILCAGNYENSTCVFLSSGSIFYLLFLHSFSKLESVMEENNRYRELYGKLLRIYAKYQELRANQSIHNLEIDTDKPLAINLNLREIFVVLTQFKIKDSLLHDLLIELDDSGFYYDDLYRLLTNKDYTSFKELVIQKNISTKKLQHYLNEYLLNTNRGEFLCDVNHIDTESALAYSSAVDFVNTGDANTSSALKTEMLTLLTDEDTINELNQQLNNNDEFLAEINVICQNLNSPKVSTQKKKEVVLFLMTDSTLTQLVIAPILDFGCLNTIQFQALATLMKEEFLVFPEYREIISNKKYSNLIKQAKAALPVDFSEYAALGENHPICTNQHRAIRELIKQKDKELQEIEAGRALATTPASVEAFEVRDDVASTHTDITQCEDTKSCADAHDNPERTPTPNIRQLEFPSRIGKVVAWEDKNRILEGLYAKIGGYFENHDGATISKGEFIYLFSGRIMRPLTYKTPYFWNGAKNVFAGLIRLLYDYGQQTGIDDIILPVADRGICDKSSVKWSLKKVGLGKKTLKPLEDIIQEVVYEVTGKHMREVSLEKQNSKKKPLK